MASDNEQRDGFLLSIWQAITLVGDARERSDQIEPVELETVLEEAESLLIGAVSEAAKHPAKPARHWRGLRFWRAAPDTSPTDVSWAGSTAVIPFPGLRLAESKVLIAGRTREVSRPAELPRLRSRGTRAEIEPTQHRDSRIGRTLRLSLLAGLTVLPLLASQACLELHSQSEQQVAIRKGVVERVRQLAADIGELREGARQLLLAIAQLDAIRLDQRDACSGLLAKLISRYPNYALLAAADLQGRIFCASGPAPASVGDQSFFTRALAHDGLVVGNYWIDPADGQKMINFALQIADDTGSPAGVIFAGLDLAWLSDHLKEAGLYRTSSKLVADRGGNIIARLPSSKEFVGKNMRASHERIMDGGEAGWEEVTGVDGVTRIFGYVPASLPPKDFFLSVGEEKDASFAAVNAATWRDAVVLLAGLLGSISAAWAGRNLVFGPTQGSAQPAVQHSQSAREDAVAGKNLLTTPVIAPTHQIGLIIRSSTESRFVFSTLGITATHFARGPPKLQPKDSEMRPSELAASQALKLPPSSMLYRLSRW
jgi:hypothetical protein